MHSKTDHILTPALDDATADYYKKTIAEILKIQNTVKEKLKEYFLVIQAEKPELRSAELADLLSPLATKLSQDDRPRNINSEDEQHLHSTDIKPLSLVEASLRNEADLLPYILYESSELSLYELQQEVETWTYEEKINNLQLYSSSAKTLKALSHMTYTWDVLCDLNTLRHLAVIPGLTSFHHQRLTPRYGYDIPVEVEEAGLADMYEECFDLSYELFSRLQSAGYHREAEYATLSGHRIRWKAMFSAYEAIDIYKLNVSPISNQAAKKVVLGMMQIIKQIHPWTYTTITSKTKSLDTEK